MIVQKRGLAAARGAEEDDVLARRDLEADIGIQRGGGAEPRCDPVGSTGGGHARRPEDGKFKDDHEATETRKTSAADGVGSRVEAGAEQRPDLDRQGDVEAGEKEGDDELVPAEASPTGRRPPRAGGQHRHGDQPQHLRLAAPRSRAARSAFCWCAPIEA
jgi:hypothetical protein